MTFTPINPMSTPQGAPADALYAALPDTLPTDTAPGAALTTPTAERRRREPYLRIQWIDEVTGATGYLVVDTLVQGMATGGTRMRAGCTLTEVEDLARGMSNKTAAFDLPIGGAKGGIDFDPKDPRALDVLTRFCEAMHPFLDRHWVTAEDLGVPQHLIDTVFARLGMSQSYHAAIERSADPVAATARVRAGLGAAAPGGLLGDVIGGYGVAQASLAAARVRGWTVTDTTVAVQGVGTMGGGAAYYLHEAGMRVVAVADALGTLYSAEGLDVPALLETRNRFGEIDRASLPSGIAQLPREAIVGTACDILIPAAVSYAITAANCTDVRTSIVVEAANAATTEDAELDLAAEGVAVLPDFIANAGAVAWAWWLLLGYVGEDYRDSFSRLRDTMDGKISALLTGWSPSDGPLRWAADVSAVERTPVPLDIP